MADVGEILEGLRIILEPGSVAELRILNTTRRTVSGYYDDFQKMARDAATWDGRAPGIYVTLNPVNPALLARSANRLTEYAKYTTGDSDIVLRRWLPIDFDPVRPAGISSTNDEHDMALDRAQICAAFMSDKGWPDGLLADSGNGAHLLYRLPQETPNDEGALHAISGLLNYLASQFNDEHVTVDVSMCNASRICKVYGTMVKKGDHTDQRPHRRSRLLLPQELTQVSA